MSKKYLLIALIIIIFAVYAIHLKLGSDESPKVAINAVPPNSPTAIPTDIPVATLGPTPQGKYKTGTYVGSVADAFYGNIQVKVIISGGKITDVQFLQYPNDRPTSIQVNSQAMPLLKQEAIAAQSAQVDGISGATQTSGAFIQSLQSALQQAS